VAGVAEPPGPAEVQDMSDAILGGAFTGDLADALERAAAFCHVVATGWALQADLEPTTDPEDAVDAVLTRRAGGLARTGSDLEEAAKMWRKGELS
jgi:hypothetical protein